MSRRERDPRDSHGKRLQSRFDREPSPKKMKRYEKPEVNAAHSSHRRWNVTEATSYEQKQRPMQDDARLEAPLVSSSPGFQNEKKSLESKSGKLSVVAKHSSDNREIPRPLSFYQHDDRSSTGQGGQNLSRRPTDPTRAVDFAKGGSNVQPKKDDSSQSRADEKTGVWRHDRYHTMESGPPPRKRPAFKEKKAPFELQTDDAASVADKLKSSAAGEQPEVAAGKRERGGFYPRELDKPEKRERRGDGFYHGGEALRTVDVEQSREGYGGMRGRADRFNNRYDERGFNRAGGFAVEKWKHDLFDEANQSPPPKNEEEQIAKIEALLAS